MVPFCLDCVVYATGRFDGLGGSCPQRGDNGGAVFSMGGIKPPIAFHTVFPPLFQMAMRWLGGPGP
jgi:hypothetical protein